MNMIRRIMPIGVAAALSLTAVCPAYASSTEFSRTAEEWAKLQDNVLEYSEIADLVHEYNATVNKNQIELNDFRKKYGVTNDQWADKYRELADNLDSAMEEPDIDSATYGTMKAMMISNEMAAKNYRETADNAVEDYQVKYFEYQSAEGKLVQAAQEGIINYYLLQLKLKSDETQLELLRETHKNTVIRQSIGASTDTEVLLAEENVKKQEKMIQDDCSSIENARQSLIVSMGWKHDDQPEIGQIPPVDEQHIAELDPETDKVTAIEKSYVMKGNRKKLENVRTAKVKETLERTIRESEQTIGSGVHASYQNVLAKKAAYDLSVAQAALEEKNYQTMERQYGLGNVSRMNYLTQKNAAELAKINVETARLNLFQAIQAYDNMVNGLAG